MTPAAKSGGAAAAANASKECQDDDSPPPDPFRDVFHMADLRFLLEGCDSWDGIDIILTRAEVLDTAGSMAKAIKGESDEGIKNVGVHAAYVIAKRLPGSLIQPVEDSDDEADNCHVRFAPDTKEEDGDEQGEKETGGADEKKVGRCTLEMEKKPLAEEREI